MHNCAEHRRDLTGAGSVVDVPVNRSDKLQQFTIVVGANCAENRCVSSRSSWALFLRYAWFESGYMFCDSCGVFVRVPHVKVALES